jgi:predicted transcriptional regulator of viral defense system
MNKKEKRPDRLYTLAESQGGYFTSADASALGYTTSHQHFHVKRENWARVGRGIYRLKNFPSTGHEDLIRWWLWSRKKGAISHESAAAVYDLGDVLPAKTHLTVPPDFRKKAAAGVVLHKALLVGKDVEMHEGFRVTTPLRTILDLARGHLDQERLTAVTKDAMRKGLLDRRTLLNILAKTPKDIAPSEQVTLQLALREE